MEKTNLVEVPFKLEKSINKRQNNVIYIYIQESDAGKTFRLVFSAEYDTDGNYASRNTGTQLITAGYKYNYEAATAYPATEEEKANSKKTFLNDSNISWSCY